MFVREDSGSEQLSESRSQRILWLLGELQAPYGVAFYQRDARSVYEWQ